MHMKLACIEYVTAGPLKDIETAADLGESIITFLTPSLKSMRIAGFQVVTVKTRDDLLDHDLDEEAIATVGGIWPLVWVNVTFDADRDDRDYIAEFASRFDLVTLAEYHHPAP